MLLGNEYLVANADSVGYHPEKVICPINPEIPSFEGYKISKLRKSTDCST